VAFGSEKLVPNISGCVENSDTYLKGSDFLDSAAESDCAA